MRPDTTTAGPRVAYAGFAAFGSLWGVWGASIPAIKQQTGLSDGQLGTALLFVGLGALPALLVAGRALDRWGQRVTAASLMLLATTGVVLSTTASGLASLSWALVALGAFSGAADVGINAAAATAERRCGRPVITRAHASFSASVVVSSLATGLLGRLGAATVVPFLLLLVAAVVPAFALAGDRGTHGGVTAAASSTTPRLRVAPLLVVGGLGALAFAVENAHQNWSAVFLTDVLDTGPGPAAAGPAVFAAVVAVTRFAAGSLGPDHATAVLLVGATVAAAGTVVLATADVVPVALLGLAAAAAGTAVLFPMLMSVMAARVPDDFRGRATSIVTSVAYLGFLAGPVYVGRWAGAADLPAALVAVAGLAVVLAALAWPGLRVVQHGRRPWTSTDHAVGVRR